MFLIVDRYIPDCPLYLSANGRFRTSNKKAIRFHEQRQAENYRDTFVKRHPNVVMNENTVGVESEE